MKHKEIKIRDFVAVERLEKSPAPITDMTCVFGRLLMVNIYRKVYQAETCEWVNEENQECTSFECLQCVKTIGYQDEDDDGIEKSCMKGHNGGR